MAASTYRGNARGNGAARAARYRPMSEINVTPLVDVMLVLLIVFMVAAPLMTVGVPIELPQTKAKPLQGDTEPITVSVNAEGKVYLQNAEIDLDALIPKLEAIANSQNTNLAVVAPGIAEALFATALGLLAAIPATIFYNKFTADTAKIGARLENFADEFSAIISRQLDERV